MSILDAPFPVKLQCLFQPKRYKVLWGGRAAGRSWGVARALLLIGLERPLRVLCARELQNSIADSVHKVLSDQIGLLGLESSYEIQRDKIIGPNGTSFSFEGIKNNVNRIKSYEGIDICWVEEAVKVSRASWGVLIPTIRKIGSEIWITFNPELETDYTYRRFVREADDSMVVVKMTYRDNPWFNETALKDEMERDKARDPDYYLNVWEGHCVQQLEGAIYARELRRAQAEGRICEVPWEREWPVDTFWDLGRADQTAIWFAQKVAMQYRVLDYYSASQFDITHFIKVLQTREYNYGLHHLPHDAFAKKLGSKRTIEEIIRQSYPGMTRRVPKLSIVDGINAARIVFPNCWFDETKCEEGLNSLRHYRYRVVDGQLSNEPLHDWASDGADAFRYLAISIKGPRSEASVPDFNQARFADRVSLATREIGRLANSGLGWLR